MTLPNAFRYEGTLLKNGAAPIRQKPTRQKTENGLNYNNQSSG